MLLRPAHFWSLLQTLLTTHATLTNVILPVGPVRPKLSRETILRVAWRGRRWLLITSIFWAFIGVGVALLLQPEYVAEVKVMPEMTNGADDVVRRLASVAGFSGLDLSETEGVEAVRPDLYPNVLQSTPFLLHLIDQPLTTADGQPTTVGLMILPENTLAESLRRWIGFHSIPAKPLRRNKPGSPVTLSPRQRALVEAIAERVSARFDTRSGIIYISARMPDATGAAAVAQMGMNYLTQYVTNYRTEKARQDLHFYARQLSEARKRYQRAQLALFRHNDQNKSVVLQAATMERQRLGDELSLAQTVYAELARQHEQARLKVQERTPVFKVLEPPTVPLERVSPKRTLLVFTFACIGLLLGIGHLLMQEMQWPERWRQLIQES